MNTEFKMPFYAKAALIIIGLFTLFSILYIAQSILVPIVYSVIIAILLNPLVRFFVKRKLNRILAISIVLTSISLLIIGCFAILSTQLNEFTDALPFILDKFYEILNGFIDWVSDNFNISTRKINKYISDSKAQALSSSGSSIALTVSSVGSALVMLVVIPVYVFMILFYQSHLVDFIYKLFGENNRKEVGEVFTSSKSIIQNYLVALLIEAGIIAVLNSIGLFVLGIEYAIVLGILGALLNIIPYLGGLIAMAIYMLIAIVTKESHSYALYVLLLYSFIQLIDNNLIMPKLVGSKVKINALIAIIAVIVGGAVWGVSGMFISLPIIAILKIIFDHIPSLKPWGFLLGDTIPTPSLFKFKTTKKQ